MNNILVFDTNVNTILTTILHESQSKHLYYDYRYDYSIVTVVLITFSKVSVDEDKFGDFQFPIYFITLYYVRTSSTT